MATPSPGRAQGRRRGLAGPQLREAPVLRILVQMVLPFPFKGEICECQRPAGITPRLSRHRLGPPSSGHQRRSMAPNAHRTRPRSRGKRPVSGTCRAAVGENVASRDHRAPGSPRAQIASVKTCLQPRECAGTSA